MLPMEVWMPDLKYPNYQVSNFGQVRGPRGRILRPRVGKRGYLCVSLSGGKRGTARPCPIHVLVVRTFLGLPKEGEEIRHLNGNPHDNRLENLAYGTRADNMQDMIRHGTQWQQGKTHCPSGHLLEAPNLVPHQLKLGWRSCRACAQAHKRVARHPELDFQTEADRYYQQITTT